MRTFPLTYLGYLRVNDKFLWNNIVYTVYQEDTDNMVEVFAKGRYFAWPSASRVTPVRL